MMGVASGPPSCWPAGPSFEFVPEPRPRPSKHRRMERPQPRGARPAEYRRPASRLGRPRNRPTIRITNTQRPGYRTAEPSDSPPRASRYALTAGRGSAGGDVSLAACQVQSAFRTSLSPRALLMVAAAARRQGSRRSRGLRRRPWRLAPLTARCDGRSPWRASRGEDARGRTYQLSLSANRMPICRNCEHRGRDHDWIVPPCSVPRCNCALQHPRRMRGRCLVPGCLCHYYVPTSYRPKPVSAVLGRWRR